MCKAFCQSDFRCNDFLILPESKKAKGVFIKQKRNPLQREGLISNKQTSKQTVGQTRTLSNSIGQTLHQRESIFIKYM